MLQRLFFFLLRLVALFQGIFFFFQAAFHVAVFVFDSFRFLIELFALLENFVLGAQFRILAQILSGFFGLDD